MNLRDKVLREERLKRLALERELSYRKARVNFYYYCQLMLPSFYTSNKAYGTSEKIYIKNLCNQLQLLYEDKSYNDKGEKTKILLINIPPRHGKTLTCALFETWVLGKSPKKKFIGASYNSQMSMRLSKQVRSWIESKSIDGRDITPCDVFPDIGLKAGDSSASEWSVSKSKILSHLATSPKSTITGFGVDFGVIDDIIKDAEEAFNETVLKERIKWFSDTFISRVEKGSKILLIMTRWAENDLAGFLLNSNLKGVKRIVYKAYNEEDDTMLCEDILPKEEFFEKRKIMSFEILEANYQQVPRKSTNSLYKNFKTYNEIPESDRAIRKCFIDPADKGDDFLCYIAYIEIIDTAYVIDIIYSKENLENTEVWIKDSLIENKINLGYVENNSGGEAVARDLKRMLNEHNERVYKTIEKVSKRIDKRVKKEANLKYRDNKTKSSLWESIKEDKDKLDKLEDIKAKTAFQTFNQRKNKVARIRANSANVINNIIFPINWKSRWSKFAKDVLDYSLLGKNQHDDAPDTLTGIFEKMQIPVIKIRSLN